MTATLNGLSDERTISSLAAAVAAADVDQMPDGKAGVLLGADVGAIGDARDYTTTGVHTVTKSTGHVIQDGGEVWFDHSAGAAISRPAQPGDRDFALGLARGDAATGDTTLLVDINAVGRYKAGLGIGGFEHIPIGTSADTVGSPQITSLGKAARLAFTATAEAQKLDLLSSESFAVASNWIVDAIVEIVTNGDADVVDLLVGVANATHATDGDSITEFAGLHLDPGADLDIMLESDDGTTEVAATDSTINFAVGTPFRLVIDGRDPAGILMFIDGVAAAVATFVLTDATGPLKLLVHLEKTSNDSPCILVIHDLKVRTMEQ